MRFFLQSLAVFAVVVLASGPTFGQGPFGGRGPSGAMLLGQESVQKELKLTDDQAAKVKEFGEAMREKFQEAFGLEGEERAKKFQELAKEGEKAVADILKPEQSKRLKEIVYQQQGPRAFADSAVAKGVGLSEEQQKKIKEINDDTGKQLRELFQPGSPPDDETRKKMQDLRKEASEKIVKLLSEDQKKKWQELQGAPFKGEIRFGPPR
jgi:Spy/CpxP family protein refolding chaperone